MNKQNDLKNKWFKFSANIYSLLQKECGHEVLAQYLEYYKETEYENTFFDILLEVIKNENHQSQATAAWILGKIDILPNRCIKELIYLLDSESVYVQEISIFALTKIGKQKIVLAGVENLFINKITKLAETENLFVKRKALEALHEFGEIKIAEPILDSKYIERFIKNIKEGYVTLIDGNGDEIRSREIIIETVKNTNIFVGIPSYKESDNIHIPANAAFTALKKYLDGFNNALIVNMGHLVTGNTKTAFIDFAKNKCKNTPASNIKFMFISTGLDKDGSQIRGKGHNFRNLFELIAIAEKNALASVVVDADLKSITPEWIREFLSPIVWENRFMSYFKEKVIENWKVELQKKVELQNKKLLNKYSLTLENNEKTNRVKERLLKIELEKRILEMEYMSGADFVAPWYSRNRYDGTITNSLVMPFMALLGVKIRQPIGGDFGFSPQAVQSWLKREWKSSTYQYGIDNFMTSSCIIDGLNIVETILGAKVHDPSAPKLNRMFVEVANTLFSFVLDNKNYWKNIKIIKNLSGFRLKNLPYDPPQKLSIDYNKMKNTFLDAFLNNKTANENKLKLKDILENDTYNNLIKMIENNETKIDNNIWKNIVFDFLSYYMKCNSNEEKINAIELFKYIYMGRAASFYYFIELDENSDNVYNWKKNGLNQTQIEKKAHLTAESICSDLASLFHKSRNELIKKLKT